MDIDTENGSGKIVRMKLFGRFDISTHAVFRNAYIDPLGMPSVEALIIDFSGVSYIDSAALGMLLLLRERAAAAGKSLRLVGSAGKVREVFEVANFFKLFDIT